MTGIGRFRTGTRCADTRSVGRGVGVGGSRGLVAFLCAVTTTVFLAGIIPVRAGGRLALAQLRDRVDTLEGEASLDRLYNNDQTADWKAHLSDLAGMCTAKTEDKMTEGGAQ